VSTFTVPINIGVSEDRLNDRLEAWVDTGSLYSWIPSDVLERLGIRAHGTRPFTLASGEEIERPVGRVWIGIEDEAEQTIVVFGKAGGQAILGAYALEGLALAVDPVNERLIPMGRIHAF